MLGRKISNALENNSFAAFLMHFILRMEHKEGYTEAGEKKLGIRLRIVNKSIYSFEAPFKVY